MHPSSASSLSKALSKINICRFTQILYIWVVAVMEKCDLVSRGPLIYLSPISWAVFSVWLCVFNLQSLSSPSFSATLLPLLLSPPTQTQIHRLSFNVSILHHFLDILMPSVDCLVSAHASEKYLNAYFLTHQVKCLTDSHAATYPNDYMTWGRGKCSQMGQTL